LYRDVPEIFMCIWAGVALHSTYCEGDKILTNDLGRRCSIMGKRMVLTSF